MTTNGECILNAVTANTTGAWVPVYGSRGNYSFQTLLTGSPTGGTITFQGSGDGVNALDLSTFVIGTGIVGEFTRIIDNPVSFIRATLAGLTGGTAPSVSVFMSVGG